MGSRGGCDAGVVGRRRRRSVSGDRGYRAAPVVPVRGRKRHRRRPRGAGGRVHTRGHRPGAERSVSGTERLMRFRKPRGTKKKGVSINGSISICFFLFSRVRGDKKGFVPVESRCNREGSLETNRHVSQETTARNYYDYCDYHI